MYTYYSFLATICVVAIGNESEAGSELLEQIASPECFFDLSGSEPVEPKTVAFKTALQNAVRNIKLCPNDPTDRL